MGIKGLWTIMAPYSEKKSLHEITGETVAVDLAGWVCDSQNVTDYYVQPKLYLRNLFFRTVYLILQDVKPIFVLEGDAPELKRDVMAARNAIQFRGAAPKSDKAVTKQPNVTRNRFKGVLRECETLLKSMGVCCVKGRGEAEATCARLNSQGLVDAVVSQDSDCFAYGARRVYRNFSVSSAGGGGAMQGSVDCYDADKMFQENGFGRKKMVALALLCGCDYGVGACGTSITTSVSFLDTVPEDQVIHSPRMIKIFPVRWKILANIQNYDTSRLLAWVSDADHYEELSRWACAPGRCERCGHAGRGHARAGCPVCATHRGCQDKGHKEKVAEVKRELSLRNRALSSGMPFPEPKVMKEFLDGTTEDIDLNALKIPAPSLIQFVKIMKQKLDWSERYCVEKFLPLLTRWHLQKHIPCRTIKPIAIKKKRNPRGVPSYVVVWEDIDSQYDALIPDDQFEEGEDASVVWTSIERQDLMRQFYPDLVESYEESIKKPSKERKGRGKKKNDDQNTENNVKPKRKYTRKPKTIKDLAVPSLNDSLKNLSLTVKAADLNSSKALNVSVSVNKLKRKIKANSKSKAKNTIDSYVVRKKKRLTEKSIRSSKNLSVIKNESIIFKSNLHNDKENVNYKQNVNYDNFWDIVNRSFQDDCDSDLSDIVDEFITKAPTVKTAKFNNKLVKLIFDKNVTQSKPVNKALLKTNCSTPKNSPPRKSFVRCSSDNLFDSLMKKNTSQFFEKLTDGGDAFEMSVENIYKDSVITLDDSI